MRSMLFALALITALAPAIEALAASASHTGCGSASSHATHDTDVDMHVAHHAAVDVPAPLPNTPNQCGCGCDCGPAHGCTAASTAAPPTTGTMLLVAGTLAPAAQFQPLSSRLDSPLYRPPILQLTI